MDLIPTNLECNSIETITLNEHTNYRLMEIKNQQNLTIKLSKYLICFGYTDKILTAFLTVFSGTNIFAHVKTSKQLLGLITSAFSLIFCLSSGIIKKLQQETKITKKRHNKLLYLAKN